MVNEKQQSDNKLILATCSLGGCFGCHMSLLDIDELLVEVDKYYTFDRSPFTDIKQLSSAVDVGLIEGGLCNEENLQTLLNFRQHCRYVVAVGACAINGGVPALRNSLKLEDCLSAVYENGFGTTTNAIPNDEELPRLLKKVLPIAEAVKIDYFLPGCPPPAPAFSELLLAIAQNRQPKIDYALRHFD